MFLLEIESLKLEVCSDAVLAKSLSLIHTVFSIICIVVPIILIVMASIQTASIMMNPDQKAGTKKIVNKFIAAVVVFFLPLIMDITMNFIPGNEFSISACWKAADAKSKSIKFSTFDGYNSKVGGMGGNLSQLAVYAGISPEGEGMDGTTGSGQVSCEHGNIIAGGLPVPVFYQNHPSCDYGAFNSKENVSNSGCGFTSMAMILTYLTNNVITPKDMTTKYKNYFIPGSGMSHSLPKAAARDYGLPAPEEISVTTSSKDKIIGALREGKVILIRGTNYPQKFSTGPHLIVLRGVDDAGNIYVNNPNYYLAQYNSQPVSFTELNIWATKAWIFERKTVSNNSFYNKNPFTGLPGLNQ